MKLTGFTYYGCFFVVIGDCNLNIIVCNVNHCLSFTHYYMTILCGRSVMKYFSIADNKIILYCVFSKTSCYVWVSFLFLFVLFVRGGGGGLYFMWVLNILIEGTSL